MKLIGSTSSAYVRKVRIVLAEKRLEYQFVQENPWDQEQTPGTGNPLGKVPRLVMDGCDAMFDSRVIVEYLDTLSPVGKLIPGTGRERAEVKSWEALADGLLDAGALARLEATWPGRSSDQRCQAWMERQLGKVRAALAVMSQGLGDKSYCCGVHFTLADVCVGSALGWLDLRFPEIAWRDEHPNLALLFAKLAERPSFASTRPE
ncbi:glutathione S-transferase family protein [Comamonas composti]|uniref:glutathione S-transferase family protein n=1 Tax=Comamonas composti TaxID=408558 RepID=UPI0004022563|nr:glutathione S-transferase C-terminal domain-containing protein [Comamonas composti]